ESDCTRIAAAIEINFDMFPPAGSHCRRASLSACAGAFLAALAGCQPSAPNAAAADLSHGIAVGEVSSNRAVIWARCDRASALRVRLDGTTQVLSTEVDAADDFTGKIALEALSPARHYGFQAWCGAAAARALRGEFRTAPAPADARPVRFAWSGDVGGQNVCRDRQRGYPIFDQLAARRLDF